MNAALAQNGLGAGAGFRAEPYGRRRRRQSALARRAGMGPGFGSCRMVRHRLGPGPPLPPRQSCSFPFSATSTAPCSRPGSSSFKFDEQEGSFAVWAYDTHKLPICPLHYARILGDAHPELERLGDAFSGLPEWRPQVGRRARRTQGRTRRALPRTGRCAGRGGGRGRAAEWRAGPPRKLARPRRADPGAILARRAFPRRRRRHQLSPLLQHQRPRRPPHGAAGGVRPRAPAGVPAAWKAACSTVCASTISTGCSIPRAI